MDNSNRKITSKSTKNNGLTIKNAVEVITPLQGELFEIETTRTIDGIEMGVFSDGTPFLSQRGVQALCGLTTNGIISNLSKEWENFYNNDFEISKRPRLSFIKKILDENGYTSPSLYIRKKFNDNDIYAYPDTVCMAILEYYAFECENPVKVAIDRYRMLAKKSFRDFVYTLVGYIPKTEELDKWKYFLDRVDLNFNNPPEGYFSIFQEMVKPIHALISNGLIVNDKTIPDASTGKCWGIEWEEKELFKKFGKRIKYVHNYPSYYPQALSNPQHPWAYPDEALPYFRKWFREIYIPSKFPSYLERKVKNLELPTDAKRDILNVLSNNIKTVDTSIKKLSTFNQNLKRAIEYKPN